ncbi:MAG: hypothetical protein WBN83_01130, partial [Desulfoprunum sp.]|uniref:hypothetical protein n=1 Tax=Desulfoprunum sp. TaxID=2020866 RepID=UPI003C72B1F1
MKQRVSRYRHISRYRHMLLTLCALIQMVRRTITRFHAAAYRTRNPFEPSGLDVSFSAGVFHSEPLLPFNQAY